MKETWYEEMTGRELSSKLLYTGMEVGIRKLALKEKLATPAELAVMNEEGVCDLVLTQYEVAFVGDEKILLVKRDDISEFEKLVAIIER